MIRAFAVLALAASLAGCGHRMVAGERLYNEGDRLGALEAWRAIPEDSTSYERSLERIAVVEEEFVQLVVRYKQRGRYFESKGRLAESILNYRLALKLQPGDAETLDHVQQLARRIAAEKSELRSAYRTHFDADDLAAAGAPLKRLRELDPFDPELEADERELGAATHEATTRLLAAGRRGFSDGNHAAARRSFEGVLEVDPDNESARGYLSYIETIRRESRRSGKQPAAFDPPEAYASDAQIRAEGFHQNALAATKNGNLYGSIRHNLRALRSDPQHGRARRHLAATREKLSGRVETLIETGREQFKDEDLQSALDSWRRALLVDPHNERAKAYAARAERQLENLERLRSDPDVSGRGR
jgi:tetratricopeptide (TPR) repeat protein